MTGEKPVKLLVDPDELRKVMQGTYTVSNERYEAIVSDALESYCYEVPKLLAEVERQRELKESAIRLAGAAQQSAEQKLAGFRDLAEWLDSELPDYPTVVAMRVKARALLGKTEDEE